MKRVRYTKFNGGLASEIDLEDLLQALSDYFLDSGYQDPYSGFQDLDRTLDDLREALKRALMNGDFFDRNLREQLEQLAAQGKLDELLDQLIERLEEENYVSSSEPWQQRAQQAQAGGIGKVEGEVRFEVTDKSLDFLGFKTLRDLLGSLGKSSYGRHDTRHWATGIETSGGSQPYQFGDVLNLDATAT
ncbi:MAG: hypothetical protein ACLGP3_10160, partial [Acidobacteriota bacterium]